jgi:biopolymer transport protein ExbD
VTRALAVAALLFGCAAKTPKPTTAPEPTTPEHVAAIDLPKSARTPTPQVFVYAKPEGASSVRVWVDKGAGTLVNVDSPAEPFTTLAREARAKLAPDTQVVLSIDRRVQHGVVVSLIDAFKREGIKKFALSVTPAPSGAPSP